MSEPSKNVADETLSDPTTGKSMTRRQALYELMKDAERLHRLTEELHLALRSANEIFKDADALNPNKMVAFCYMTQMFMRNVADFTANVHWLFAVLTWSAERPIGPDQHKPSGSTNDV